MGSTKQTTATVTTPTRTECPKIEQDKQQAVQGEDDGEHAQVDREPVRPAGARCDDKPNRRPPICRCERFWHCMPSILPLHLVLRHVSRKRRQLSAKEEKINVKFLQGEIIGSFDFLQHTFSMSLYSQYVQLF